MEFQIEKILDLYDQKIGELNRTIILLKLEKENTEEIARNLQIERDHLSQRLYELEQQQKDE